MNRRIIIGLLLICFLGVPMAFAQTTPDDHVRNNRYYLESVRLTNLAHAAFEEGDYDASRQYAEEAVRYAQLSDEYVALQLKIKEANDAIAAAEARMNWAGSSAVNASTRFPTEYNAALAALNEARNFRNAENWDAAIDAAGRVINSLAYVTDTSGAGAQPPAGTFALPAQYTVRTWAAAKDCFWNIAAMPTVYNDPYQWRVLYNANRAKLPEPNNPDLVHPGTVLDIPSLRGEAREGMWVAGRTYASLPR